MLRWKSKIGIDKSKFITFDGTVRWIFGLVDRGEYYDMGIFYIYDNMQKETILPIVKNNVQTNKDEVFNNGDRNDINLPTRIYSDSFQRYQEHDFNYLGYIPHRINRSFWFDQG